MCTLSKASCPYLYSASYPKECSRFSGVNKTQLGAFSVISFAFPEIHSLFICILWRSSSKSFVMANAYPEYVDPISIDAMISGTPVLPGSEGGECFAL